MSLETRRFVENLVKRIQEEGLYGEGYSYEERE